MKKYKFIFVILGVGMISFFLGFIGFNSTQNKKLAYVNSIELYDSFNGKKEMEKDFEKKIATLKIPLDSLELLVRQNKMLGVNSEKAQLLEHRYNMLYNEISEKERALRESYISEIWVQLNEFINDFGEKEGYNFILSAHSDSDLLYADKNLNITESLKEYVNKRYEGKY